MERPSGSTRARLFAIGLLVWPLLPVLTIWPGAWLGKGAATLAFVVMLGPGALWCLVGLAVSLGLGLTVAYRRPLGDSGTSTTLPKVVSDPTRSYAA